MRTIEITTTQNVTIEYELAAVSDRVQAFLIDMAIIWLSSVILFLFFQAILPEELRKYTVYFTALPVFLFYSLLSETWANGQSWGKKISGIKVVKISGTEASLNDYMIRWAFRIVDIYLSLGTIGILLISSTGKAQRLGDIVANTAVIRTKPKSYLKLSNIMKINSQQNYIPHYPQVISMKESEMMVVKNVLDRLKFYPNDAHREAMYELVDVMRERLNITEETTDPQHFLRTLLNDYIVLTR